VYVVMNSERVQSLREEKGLSKRGLASLASVSEATLRRIEREEPVCMTNATTQKVEVKVGSWWPDETFVGEIVRFSGEELGSWTECPEAHGEYRVKTYTVYRTPAGEYRIRQGPGYPSGCPGPSLCH
jgi:DNA-binding XRE family transcriptional regulator